MRAYSLHEVGKLMHAAGFRVLEVSGGYQMRGRFFGNQSRHIIVVLERGDPLPADSSDSSSYGGALPQFGNNGGCSGVCLAGREDRQNIWRRRASELGARPRARRQFDGSYRHEDWGYWLRSSSSRAAASLASRRKRREALEGEPAPDAEADAEIDAAPPSRATAKRSWSRRRLVLDGGTYLSMLPGTWPLDVLRPERVHRRARSRRSRSCCGRRCSRTRPPSSTSSRPSRS